MYSKSNGTENEMDELCVGNTKNGTNGAEYVDGKHKHLSCGGGEEYVIIIENVAASGEEKLMADDLSSGIGTDDEAKKGARIID